jgi:hypothetical protein
MVWMAFPDSKIADGEQGIAFFYRYAFKIAATCSFFG